MVSSAATWQSLLLETEAFIMSVACASGLVANVITITVACVSPHLRYTRIYVINRALADIIFLVTVPLEVTSHLLGSWVFSPILCKVRCSVAFTSLLASSYFLVGMTAEVNVAFSRPRASKKFHSAMAKVLVGLTWSLFLVFSFPPLFQSEVLREVRSDRHHCVSIPISLDTLFGHVLRFLAVVAVCFIPLLACIVLLRLASKNQHVVGVPHDPDNPKVKGLWHPRILQRCLVLAFILCHVPYWTPYLLKEVLREDLFTEKAMVVFPATMCLPAICAVVSPALFLLSNNALKKRIVSERAQELEREYTDIPLQTLSSQS